MYKYRKEHNRVEGNGHGFGHKNIEMKIEQGDVMQSRTEWDLGSGFGKGVRGWRHETARTLEHETCGETE